MSDLSIEEAAEILLKAEKIKSNPSLFKAAKESLSKHVSKITSIADLRKMNAQGLTKKDLMTEEDKAAFQEKIETDKKAEEMGIKVKDKVKMDPNSPDLLEKEKSDD